VGADAALWAKLVLAVLATWRLTHLIAREDGPAELVARLRASLGAGWLGHLMDCFNCASLWVAAPIAWWLATALGEGIVLWLALSGGACLLERASGERLVVQPINPEVQGETHHGMLRTESKGLQPSADCDLSTAGAAAEPAWAERIAGRLADGDLADSKRSG
jgi:hypothetical protein